MKCKGSCHCGKVAFEVEGSLEKVNECNCSICHKKGVLHWFLPKESFTLLTDESNLSTYTFNNHVIKHRFCGTCGVAPYGEGQAPSGEFMVSINARCLDDVDLSKVERGHFDGRSL